LWYNRLKSTFFSFFPQKPQNTWIRPRSMWSNWIPISRSHGIFLKWKMR
jgi:hypothetical protein